MRRIFLLVALLSLSIHSVLAAGGLGILETAEKAGLTITCPVGAVNCAASGAGGEIYSITGTQDFVLRLLAGLLNFVALIAVVMLIVVALRLVTSHGNQEALATAKKQIIWTLAGLFIIILALLIVKNITQKAYEIAAVDETIDPNTEVEEPIVDPVVPVINCETLSVDGLLGPLTYEARNETMNLAYTFKGGADCIPEYQGVFVGDMRERNDGEQACAAVKSFQAAYNGRPCDTTTGDRIDI